MMLAVPAFPGRGIWPVGLVAVCIAAGGCASNAQPTAMSDVDDGSLELRLSVEPTEGDAPLEVRLRAEIVGEIDDPVRFRCATAAFTLGDGNVTHVRPAEVPCRGEVQRVYEAAHVYRSAGSFGASVRLIARPLKPSRIVSVLVFGATPTPVPLAAIPGPTIIIATSGPPAAPATPVAAAGGGTSLPGVEDGAGQKPAVDAPTASPTPAPSPAVAGVEPTARAPEPSSAGTATSDGALAVADVLPADLYYVEEAVSDEADAAGGAVGAGGAGGGREAGAVGRSGARRRLARIPSSGVAPETVGDAEDVRGYAVSSLGLVAVLDAAGRLSLRSPVGGVSEVARSGAASPVWSRDGRQLAYRLSGDVRLFNVVAFDDVGLRSDAEPLSFSRDGSWLLVRAANGEPVAVRVDGGAERRLPVAAAEHAGWLPDRNVIWLSGPGLRFVEIEEFVQVFEVLGPGTPTSAVFIRPDRKALLLARAGGQTELRIVDLEATAPRAEVAGTPLPLDVDADIAWSPDGRLLAVASGTGLFLVDPFGGAAVPLVNGRVSFPRWSVALR